MNGETDMMQLTGIQELLQTMPKYGEEMTRSLEYSPFISRLVLLLVILWLSGHLFPTLTSIIFKAY